MLLSLVFDLFDNISVFEKKNGISLLLRIKIILK